jgi:hypothetical protein
MHLLLDESDMKMAGIDNHKTDFGHLSIPGSWQGHRSGFPTALNAASVSTHRALPATGDRFSSAR